jgi:hypothetical protein
VHVCILLAGAIAVWAAISEARQGIREGGIPIVSVIVYGSKGLGNIEVTRGNRGNLIFQTRSISSVGGNRSV